MTNYQKLYNLLYENKITFKTFIAVPMPQNQAAIAKVWQEKMKQGNIGGEQAKEHIEKLPEFFNTLMNRIDQSSKYKRPLHKALKTKTLCTS